MNIAAGTSHQWKSEIGTEGGGQDCFTGKQFYQIQILGCLVGQVGYV